MYEEFLKQIEDFSLESGVIPPLADSNIKEFTRLNHALNRLMENSVKSYKTQKEFTENASHELQTPLAIFQSKLDILLQQPDLTESQAEMIQGLYQVSNRLARLNRNLLLLARIDNKQYNQMDSIDLVITLKELSPFLESLTEGITLHQSFQHPFFIVKGNKILLESLINNLVVNAVRHNTPGGDISITLQDNRFIISNTSEEGALDPRLLFNRFYRPSEKIKGNGLGLAIVKAICDYHGWQIGYQYQNNRHYFIVQF